jgi:serine/threonine protein kinase
MLSSSQLTTLHNYTIHHLIGEGSFGRVYEAEETSTHTRYAVKVLPKNQSTDVEWEIKILSSLTHNSCIHLHEVLHDADWHYLVLETASNGTLLQHLNHRHSHNHKFTERDARRIFRQLLAGVRYLHDELQIAHLDLKLENVMIDSTSKVKIIDFGQSRPIVSLPKYGMRCGSPPYCAPEMLIGRPLTTAVDVWSMGVILFALVTGTFPFAGSDENQLRGRILFDELTFPGDVTTGLRDLIGGMLEKDHSKRITLSGIANHEWVKAEDLTYESNETSSSFLPRLEGLNSLNSLTRIDGKIRLSSLRQSVLKQEVEEMSRQQMKRYASPVRLPRLTVRCSTKRSSADRTQ